MGGDRDYRFVDRCNGYVGAVMEPGVYINLSEEEYFDVDALGSSDMKKLLREPHDWWYSSRHNPHYEPPQRGKHLQLGQGLHALLLEGSQAYEARFSIVPDPLDHPGALKTAKDITAFLKNMDIHVPSGLSKGELVRLAVDNGLGGRIWDHIIAKHTEEVELFNKISIEARHDRALRAMAQLVETEPGIADGLKIGIPEVSVFWRRPSHPEILLRARLDSLNEGFTLDLKTLSNWKGRTIQDMPRRQIEEFEYDIQRRFYDEARQALREHVWNGDVFFPRDEGVPADSEEESRIEERLESIAEREEWKWVWLFYQVRDDKAGKAPIVIPRWHRPVGTVYDEAAIKVNQAIGNYVTLRDQFGLDQPWFHIEQTLEIQDEDLGGLIYKSPV